MGGSNAYFEILARMVAGCSDCYSGPGDGLRRRLRVHDTTEFDYDSIRVHDTTDPYDG